MDPTSQDNSFGSFGPSGNNPGASSGVPGNSAMNVGSVPVASGPVPASGAPVSGSMASNGLGQMGQVGQTDQAQAYQTSRMDMMNQMGINPMTTSPESGDIVIGGSGKDKKKWIIGVVVFIVLVLLGVGGYFLVSNIIKNSGILATSGFNELAELLVNGDGVVDIESSDYIYAVAISNQSGEAISSYYDRLSKQEEVFWGDVKNVLSSELIDEYSDGLKILKNAINYEKETETIKQLYLDEGDDVVWDYFNDTIACYGYNGLGVLCNTEEEYYASFINKLSFYSKAGCYDDELYFDGCAKKYYGESEYETAILDYLPESTFRSLILSGETQNKLSKTISEMNDKVEQELKNA
ncbi:MAG: hypothetical protein Q4A70_01555 [Candidatus Saccharibacteria bacterium]|nr:hypothetical protein [Candidatus Saccharibacteria bacterium]